MSFTEGDYFYCKDADDKGRETYSIFRCLKIDSEYGIAHVALFEPKDTPPAEGDATRLKIRALHLPIEVAGFDEPVVFARKPVDKDELEGYYAYLRHVDFHAWLEETGADIDAMTKEAEKLFDKATALAEKNEFEEAAEFYYQSFEAFPLYYEALDNAGLCLLDAERHEDAISCFEESIEVNGNTFMTDFSIAECYHAMDRLDEAEEWYKKARDLPGLTPEQKKAVGDVLSGT